jgi:hypothetical protein
VVDTTGLLDGHQLRHRAKGDESDETALAHWPNRPSPWSMAAVRASHDRRHYHLDVALASHGTHAFASARVLDL